MRTTHRVVETENYYFITSTIVEWIPIFNKEKFIEFLIEAIRYNQTEKDLKVYAYVIMPDHFHMIAQSTNLSAIMRSIKSYSAKKIIDELKKNKNENLLNKFTLNKKQHKTASTYQIWQEGFHPQIILTDKFLEQKVNYIHYNPVKKGLVDKPENWKYSSYSHYYFDKECFIKIVDYD